MSSEESAPSTSMVDPESQEDPTVVTGESQGSDKSGESGEISKIVEDQTAQEEDKSSEAAEIAPIVEAQTVQEEDKSEVEVTEEEEVTGDAEPEKDAEESTGEEESESPRKLTIDDIKTAPMDFRFPTTNQAKHCFTRYVEYHRCVQVKGEDNTDCDKYARYYRSLCPNEWVERWNEQRENGTFAGPL